MPTWRDELVPVRGQEERMVPWWVAALAYREYCERFPHGRILASILNHGGFGQNELIDYLAHLARRLLEEREDAGDD